MRTNLLILTVAAYSVLPVGAQDVDWLRSYDFSNWGPLLAPDSAGNVYGTSVFAGTVDLDGHVIEGSMDVFVAKWNDAGVVQWARSFGDGLPAPIADNDQPLAIAFDPVLNEVVVVGFYNTQLEFDHDTLLAPIDPDHTRLFVARFTATGECRWARYATGAGDRVVQISIDADSDVHLVGTMGGTFQGDPDITIPFGGYHAVYSANGDLLSAERIIEGGYVRGIAQLPNGRYVITVRTSEDTELFGTPLVASAGSGAMVAVAATDLVGTVDWMVPFRGSGDGLGAHLCEVTSADQIVFRGGFRDSLFLPNDTITEAPGVLKAFVASLDLSGELQWVRPFVSSQDISLGDEFDSDADGNIHIFGSFEEVLSVGGSVLHANTRRQGFLVKLDPEGACRAAWGFGKVAGPFGSVVASPEGIYFSCAIDSVLTFAGNTIPTPNGTAIMVTRLDSLSGFTGVQHLAPGGGGPLHIYANPNNGLCTVELPESLQTTPDLMLSIYDNTGQLVQRMPLQFTENGVALDIRAQARGIYHLELGDGQQRYTGTIVFE